MKEQNIIRMKCITILLFIILSVVLIVVGFSQEYRSSSLFSGGVGGLIVSLYMLKTIWSAKASQRKREQLIIDETDERNLLIQKNQQSAGIQRISYQQLWQPLFLHPYIMKKPSTAALTFSWAFSCLPIY